jgi:hypothetical protein
MRRAGRAGDLRRASAASGAINPDRARHSPAFRNVAGGKGVSWLQGSEEDSGFNGAIRAERAQRAEQSVLSCQRSARHLQVRRKLAAYG